MSLDRSGLMIIRIWFEPGSSKPLRVRMRTSSDVSTGFDREITVADAASASEVLKAWLDEAEARAESARDFR